MNTKVVRIKEEEKTRETLEKNPGLLEAAEILKNGGLVAFPTETVYGLGANALNEEAAKKIYAAKGRPSDNPLIAHISCMEELPAIVKEIPEAGRKLFCLFTIRNTGFSFSHDLPEKGHRTLRNHRRS